MTQVGHKSLARVSWNRGCCSSFVANISTSLDKCSIKRALKVAIWVPRRTMFWLIKCSTPFHDDTTKWNGGKLGGETREEAEQEKNRKAGQDFGRKSLKGPKRWECISQTQKPWAHIVDLSTGGCKVWLRKQVRHLNFRRRHRFESKKLGTTNRIGQILKHVSWSTHYSRVEQIFQQWFVGRPNII